MNSNVDRLKEKLKNAAKAEQKNQSVPLENKEKVIQNNTDIISLNQKLIDLDINILHSNPFQPRTKFENIKELAENIIKHGLLQPITVYFNDIDKKYYIIAGERRFRALKYLIDNKELEQSTIRVNLIENILTDSDKKTLATLENTHRDNMTIIDMANNAASYASSGMSYSEISELFGVGKTVISRYIKISKLPQQVQSLLNTKEVKSPNKIEMLNEIEDPKIQLEFAQLILEDISISQLEFKIKKYLKKLDGNFIKSTILETPFDKVKPVSKIISKAKYRKLTENDKIKADEILIEILKLQDDLTKIASTQ